MFDCLSSRQENARGLCTCAHISERESKYGQQRNQQARLCEQVYRTSVSNVEARMKCTSHRTCVSSAETSLAHRHLIHHLMVLYQSLFCSWLLLSLLTMHDIVVSCSPSCRLLLPSRGYGSRSLLWVRGLRQPKLLPLSGEGSLPCNPLHQASRTHQHQANPQSLERCCVQHARLTNPGPG